MKGFLRVSPFALGFVRIFLGVLLLVTLFAHWNESESLPWGRPQQSTLWKLCWALVFAAFTVGWRTRLAQFLALLGHASLPAGPESFALGSLLLWTLFLPLSRRWSVDALLLKMKHSRVETDEAGNAELVTDLQTPELFTFEAESQWAMLGVTAQVAAMLFFSRTQLGGAVWIPLVLLLVPPEVPWVRRAGVLAGLAVTVVVPLTRGQMALPAAMFALHALLIPHEDWVRVLTWLGKTRAGSTLYFDADCGVCTTCAKTLMCLHRSRPGPAPYVVKANTAAVLDVGVTAEQVNESVLWVDADKRQVWHARVFGEVVKTIRPLWPFAWVFSLGVAERAYKRFAANRHVFSAYMGLGACGIKRAFTPFPGISAFEQARVEWGRRAGLVVLVFVAMTFVGQVLVEGKLAARSPFTSVAQSVRAFDAWQLPLEEPRRSDRVTEGLRELQRAFER